jgi:hypothetical protein
MTLMGKDHLDLLLSAALDYQVPLPASTRAAFSQLVPITVIASEVGATLTTHNAAAQGHNPGRRYTFTAVTEIEPVAVIKAAHAMMAVCRADPHWDTSASAQFLTDLVHAATVRIHGYDTAEWEWHRPPARLGASIGCATTWQPPLPSMTWIPPDQLTRQAWRSARRVVLTAEATEQLPTDLEPRTHVIVLVGETSPTARQWEAAARLCADAPVIAWWPAARDWLSAQMPELPWSEFADGVGA